MGGRTEEEIKRQYEDIKKYWGQNRYLDYLKIKCFKGQTAYELEENSREKVQEIIEQVCSNVKKARDKTDPNWIKEQFEILLKIKGVGVPIASVILHFLVPNT